MEEVLLDTDALIELHKNRERVRRAHILYNMYISVINLYEYLFGLIRRGRDLEREKAALESLYEVIPLDQGVLSRALVLDVELTGLGYRLEFRDLIVGASALERGLSLVTGNIRHFRKLEDKGLSVLRLKDFLEGLQ